MNWKYKVMGNSNTQIVVVSSKLWNVQYFSKSTWLHSNMRYLYAFTFTKFCFVMYIDTYTYIHTQHFFLNCWHTESQQDTASVDVSLDKWVFKNAPLHCSLIHRAQQRKWFLLWWTPPVCNDGCAHVCLWRESYRYSPNGSVRILSNIWAPVLFHLLILLISECE